MGPPLAPVLGPGDVLPAARREKAVIAAGDELRAVLEYHAIRGLDASPVVEHARAHVAPVGAAALRAVDLVADLQPVEPLLAAVRHEDRRVAPQTVRASMSAAAIRVDRPAKRHLRRLGHAVDRRLRVDLVEADVERLRRVEPAHGGGIAVARQPRALVLVDGQVAPAHEHMFAQGPDAMRGRVSIRGHGRDRPSRPRRDVAGAQPGLLPWAARAARLRARQRDRGRARRARPLPRADRRDGLGQPARGAVRRPPGPLRPLRRRPAPPRVRRELALGRRRARRRGCASAAPRSRAARRSTTTRRATTRSSSTTPTPSSSRSCTAPARTTSSRRCGA